MVRPWSWARRWRAWFSNLGRDEICASGGKSELPPLKSFPGYATIILVARQQTLTLPAVSSPAITENGFRIPERQIPEKSITFDTEIAGALIEAARQTAESAYAPYSNFRVGAAVVMADDSRSAIFSGCNVENASYGATVCAERNAIFSAAATGFRRIGMLALSTIDSLDAALEGRSPCGVCRQVIGEFADENTLILIDTAASEVIGDLLDIDRLLPWRFALSVRSE